MVYKVVSTKLNDDEYAKLVDSCNLEGVSVSFMVKDAIMMRIDPDYLMKKIIEKMDMDANFFSQITKKIQEKTQKSESMEWTMEDLKKALSGHN